MSRRLECCTSTASIADCQSQYCNNAIINVKGLGKGPLVLEFHAINICKTVNSNTSAHHQKHTKHAKHEQNGKTEISTVFDGFSAKIPKMTSHQKSNETSEFIRMHPDKKKYKVQIRGILHFHANVYKKTGFHKIFYKVFYLQFSRFFHRAKGVQCGTISQITL